MAEWFAVEGIPDDDPNDLMWELPASSLDVPVLPGPLSQARRGDMQIWSFLLATALNEGHHPLEVRTGADPPDRVLTTQGCSWALELTEFTVPEVRADLARARAAGRTLRDALLEDPARFEHLKGRRVALGPATLLEPLPKDANQSIPAVVAALEEDRGYVGEGVDFSHGLPETLPKDRGFYGEHGPFYVQVDGGGTPGKIVVSGSAQASLRRSEALAALAARIAAKDGPENELLLITCRLPDEWGYLCPLDEMMFGKLHDAFRAHHKLPGPAPQHLKAVVMHAWDGPAWFELYRAPGTSVPWAI